MRLVLEPVVGHRAGAGVLGPREEPAVGADLVVALGGDDELGGLHLVGVVEAREPVAVGDRFALRPDDVGHVRLVGAGTVEVQPAGGIVHAVLDGHRRRVACDQGRVEKNLQELAVVRVTGGRGPSAPAGQGDRSRLEVHRVQGDRHYLAEGDQTDPGGALDVLRLEIDVEVELDVQTIEGAVGGEAGRILGGRGPARKGHGGADEGQTTPGDERGACEPFHGASSQIAGVGAGAAAVSHPAAIPGLGRAKG